MINVVHCKRVVEHEYIGRPSPLGNPFPLKKGEAKGSTLVRYREWIMNKIEQRDEEVINELNRLLLIAREQELNLGCWCAPSVCHGDIIKELLESKL